MATSSTDHPATLVGVPRLRTVGNTGRAMRSLDDGQLISLEDAQHRMAKVIWPETALLQVRFFDGDLHLSATDRLFAPTEELGFGIAIQGDLIIDGLLDAVAGGNGFDSVLVVEGDVWANAAVFRHGIKASISGAFEVATVVMCDHGDDGGTLWADAIRAQVVSYSLYFPRPDAQIDALCIGDVYGEESFSPSRANEVFISEVLVNGALDEALAIHRLRRGEPIVR